MGHDWFIWVWKNLDNRTMWGVSKNQTNNKSKSLKDENQLAAPVFVKKHEQQVSEVCEYKKNSLFLP